MAGIVVQVALALLGYALIANYLAGYLVFAAWLVVMYPLVLLEERELRERFGEAYDAYCHQAPRFKSDIGPDTPFVADLLNQ